MKHKTKICPKCHTLFKGSGIWCFNCKGFKNMADEETETPLEGEFPEEVPAPETPPEEETPNAPEEL